MTSVRGNNEQDITGKDIFNSNPNVYKSNGSASDHLSDI